MIEYGGVGHVGQGGYVRIVFPGASSAGLVMLKGAKAGLAFRKRSKLCAADEVIRAKAADIRSHFHMVNCKSVLPHLKLMERGVVLRRSFV